MGPHVREEKTVHKEIQVESGVIGIKWPKHHFQYNLAFGYPAQCAQAFTQGTRRY